MKTGIINIKGIKGFVPRVRRGTRNACGFTLIEILVVISVIGILVSIVFVSFTSAQKAARDASRKSDLKQYQNALEVFANKKNGLYPSRIDIQGASASSALCGDLTLNNCPEDRRFADDPSFRYLYQSNGSGLSGVYDASNYVLWGKLEGAAATYWVICSSGQTGGATASIPPTGGICPI
ncbi:hypothetical protein A2125_01700 [Candidatus Woesebacteria bacterium GWB1_43_5]|uniref:Type II secretion system protein GspG C-terminal domain-containing protein n=1 Tax=Candidatus Woesebacteria bacterium GWB1_43_5 TaxID=1802474 RepID=A0A1F7WSP8_9BACT|nr:MAG: hypothetical protein A2125_01700 [Candidatus Woesebacteria bacterium GWB1_43_5]